jgi:Pvc16 N-terminal domain/Carboxypeptidase regulatory-like domain
MALVVHVPLNTMLADLDETLRSLLRRELERHGFDGVEIAFDAPAREWSGQLSSPTVNLFLYDMRESHESRPTEWMHDRGGNGNARDIRPPMLMECSYAVTAWTQAVEDEHRLLSQVLAVLFAFPSLPADAMPPRLQGLADRYPIEGRIAQPKADGKADFWNAVGGQYKASLDYVVTIACESGTALERGPEVRTQTVTQRLSDGPARTITEMHRFGGTVANDNGEPVAGAWVALPGLGLLASTNADGRFIFNRVGQGTHEVVVRTREGDEATAEVQIPGAKVDLVIGATRKPSRKGN